MFTPYVCVIFIVVTRLVIIFNFYIDGSLWGSAKWGREKTPQGGEWGAFSVIKTGSGRYSMPLSY